MSVPVFGCEQSSVSGLKHGQCRLLLGILPLHGLVVVLSQQCSECTPVQFCEALLTVLVVATRCEEGRLDPGVV